MIIFTSELKFFIKLYFVVYSDFPLIHLLNFISNKYFFVEFLSPLNIQIFRKSKQNNYKYFPLTIA